MLINQLKIYCKFNIKLIIDSKKGIFRIWNNKNEQINTTIGASQLSTKEALRSLTCRARQDVNKTLRNLFLLILGNKFLIKKMSLLLLNNSF